MAPFFGRSTGKLPRKKGISEKVVLFSRYKLVWQKSLLHFSKGFEHQFQASNGDICAAILNLFARDSGTNGTCVKWNSYFTKWNFPSKFLKVSGKWQMLHVSHVANSEWTHVQHQGKRRRFSFYFFGGARIEVKDLRRLGMFQRCIRRSRSCFGITPRYLRVL